MLDPQAELARLFRAAIASAFPAERDADPMIRPSQHADFQANGAMAIGKRLGKKPRDVAEAVVAALPLGEIIAKAELAGPGFVNLTVADGFLSRQTNALAAHPTLGVELAAPPETVVVDYSSPNVAKEMHVGHLRSTILGDCLARVLEAVGHRVVRQNHLGDWGTPFGMLIEHLLDLGAAEGADVSVSDLDAFYKAARAKFDADPAFAERSRQRVVALQGGDAATLALWRRLVDASTRYFGALYERLGIRLGPGDIAGESFYNPMLPAVVSELREKGIAETSDEAICVFVEGFTNKEGAPLPLMVQKTDGGYGYATTDLAAVRYRAAELGATRLLYVVGAPQAQHFAMVFAAARRAGWLPPAVRAEHVAFGLILGPDKRPFKTRTGENVKLAALVDEAEARAAAVVRDKAPDLPEEALRATAHAVGVGAIKYADLSSDRIKDYVFDWDRMLAFDGNTAPYLMYAHARICSILRKAGEGPRGPIVIAAPAERALAFALLRFGVVVSEVAERLAPHLLCTHLFELAAAFMRFFEQCPVLKADTAAERASRLALAEATARTLARGLELLGIAAPERM